MNEYRWYGHISGDNHRLIDQPVFTGTVEEIRQQINDYLDDLGREG